MKIKAIKNVFKKLRMDEKSCQKPLHCLLLVKEIRKQVEYGMNIKLVDKHAQYLIKTKPSPEKLFKHHLSLKGFFTVEFIIIYVVSKST